MSNLEHIMGTGVPPRTASAIAGGGATGLVATGSTAADALQLTDTWVAITTSTGSPGVILPKMSAGYGGIYNNSGVTVTVYPGTGNTLNAAATSFSLTNGKSCIYFKTSATTWATNLTA